MNLEAFLDLSQSFRKDDYNEEGPVSLYFHQNPSSLKNLIQFIIEESPDPLDKDRTYKYPYLASKMITNNIILFYQFFINFDESVSSQTSNESVKQSRNHLLSFDQDITYSVGKKFSDETMKLCAKTSLKDEEENENLLFLFSFLNKNKKINKTLLGYFQSIVLALLNQIHAEICQFIFKNKVYIECLIENIEEIACRDIIESIFIMIANCCNDETMILTKKLELIDDLILILSSKNKIEVIFIFLIKLF